MKFITGLRIAHVSDLAISRHFAAISEGALSDYVAGSEAPSKSKPKNEGHCVCRQPDSRWRKRCE